MKTRSATLKKKKRSRSNREAGSRAAAVVVPKVFASGVVVERVFPAIDDGQFPVKWIVGEPFQVTCIAYRDGHDLVGASLLIREVGEREWQEILMTSLGNDQWTGCFTPQKNTRYEYTVEGWTDVIGSWSRHVEKKCRHELKVQSEVDEGIKLLKELSNQFGPEDRRRLRFWTKRLQFSEAVSEEVIRIIKSEQFEQLLKKSPLKAQRSLHSKTLELYVDRKRAEYGSWYELFPRSQGKKKNRSGTFRDCVKRLPDIKKMGFDVIYLPPIHPIGVTNRKGPNNTLTADKNAPGCPWAIGSKAGGHKSIHPELGTIKDFENFAHAAADYGIEIALDFAAQCAPDHPYVKAHPDWFYRLPDGTIRYAENPPKKYQDIFPLNFYCKDYHSLWAEMKSIILFWIKKGVHIFRVDNPHTKPLRFWQWLIREVQNEYPDTVFFAEAFTRPDVMKFLAKAGFTQSYTYFTWRNTKRELRSYVEELLHTDMRYYFRGNFFANTPDILHEYLQHGGRAAFQVRAVLAGTLSSSYGIYSGFELCENTPLHAGSEEYLNSEKYDFKVRDWDAPGNIKDLISQINRIRSENTALQQYGNFAFFETRNDHILAYGKWNRDRSNVIVVVVNLDPHNTHEDLLTFPIDQFGLQGWQTYQMLDLLTGEKYHWKGHEQYIRLDPNQTPAHVFKLKV
jgi:starch synthase (maltosyl-transferring)